jgi:endonuclease-3
MDTIMPATTNKQKVLDKILTSLKKRYEPQEPEQRPVLEQFMYAICREGATRQGADRAYQNLRDRFFDWNEVRVSSAREVEDALEGLPDSELRAQRVISFLQEVFETTYSFDLESMHKKGLKQAAKQLSRYQAATDFAVAWVTQQSLGGHAVPLDAPAMRALRRLGLIEEEMADPEAVRGGIEHLIPKAKAVQFCEILSALAHDVCADDDPTCKACQLASECPTAHLVPAAASERHGRSKSR